MRDNKRSLELFRENKNITIDEKLLEELLAAFPKSFVHHHDPGEFIVEPRVNTFFRIDNVKNRLELEAKVIAYVSRPSYKGAPNQHSKDYHLRGLNIFLGTNFDEEDIKKIYGKFGGGCQKEKCFEFIDSNYNFELLKEEK